MCEYFGRHYQIISTGDKACYKYIHTIIKKVKCKNIINMSGKTSIAEIIIILNYARAYVSIDTGISHIAIGLAKSSLIIFGRANFKNYIPLPFSKNILYTLPKSDLYPFYSPYFVSNSCQERCPYNTEFIQYEEVKNLLNKLIK